MYPTVLRRYVLTLCALCLCVPFLARERTLEQVAAPVAKPQQNVYLTFDDGPSANTDRVLDLLLSENVRATFFVVGVETEEGIARYHRILDEGHVLGLHSYTHNTAKIYRSLSSYQEDFERLRDWIAEKTGGVMKICRMVGGSNTRECPATIREQILSYLYDDGYACYDWDIDPLDSGPYALDSNQIARNVISAAKRKPDQDLIVLLHDDSLRRTLPEALEIIIAYFKEQGFSFGVLSEDAVAGKRVLPKSRL